MRYTLTLLLLIVFLPAVQSQDVPKPCPESLPPRLTVDEAARVTPGAANNVRSRPEADAELVGQLPGGSLFTVLDGPACGNGFTWWRVRSGDVVGWTVEGSDEYWLDPLPGMAVYEDDFIRFALDSDWLTSVTYEYIEEEPTDRYQNSPYPAQHRYEYELGPELSEHRPPTLRIFRVADITEDFPHHYPVLTELTALLRDRPTDMLRVETPVTAAFQIGIARPTYFDFVNGTGLVYVTGYAQDTAPFYINQYEFAGLTSNGEYYIWGSFPLEFTMPETPFDRSQYIEWDEETRARYDEYVARTASYWNERTDDAFTPNLEGLRRILETIEILGM